jgi:DNA-binding NarL/FixJ family response regulator
MPSTIGILVVEDHLPFRKLICSMLETRTELVVLAEVSDGIEAVHKAKELCPDLILLDVGLPILNGLEAARQIREIAPESKIAFLSQETSVDVVREAIRLGASGYVFKENIGRELLRAIDAVLQGKQFVSTGISVNHGPEMRPAD